MPENLFPKRVAINFALFPGNVPPLLQPLQHRGVSAAFPAQDRRRGLARLFQEFEHKRPLSFQGFCRGNCSGRPVENGRFDLLPAGQHLFLNACAILCQGTLVAAFNVDPRGERPLQHLPKRIEVIPRGPAQEFQLFCREERLLVENVDDLP